MDESEGLQKLTEYLKQTRRQAETAIDNLNGQIAALVKENDKLTNVILSLQQERDHFRTQLETIQQFHSTKAIFKERDDWRALVDNIQSDRTRLHEENGELHEQLRESQAIIQDLVKQVEYFREERTHLSMQVEELEQRFHSDQNHKEPDTPTKENIQLSPVRIRDGHHIDFFPGSPRSVMRQLKFELKKAYEEMEANQLITLQEMTRQDEELKKLREKCSEGEAVHQHILTSPIAPHPKNRTKEHSSWIEGLLGFVFSSPSDESSKKPMKILTV